MKRHRHLLSPAPLHDQDTIKHTATLSGAQNPRTRIRRPGCTTASHRLGCRVSQTSGLRVWGVVRHLSTNGGRSGEQAREASVAKATRSSETVTLCAPAWFTQFRLPKTNKTQFMLRQPISQVIPPRTHLLLTRSTRSL